MLVQVQPHPLMKRNKIIGVIGGMGPQASCEFYRLLIDKSIKDYGVVNNDDFPEILIDSVPVPDFIENTKNLSKARNILMDRVRRMCNYPVDTIGIACNTAHILLEDLRYVSSAPIVSIIEEVAKELNHKRYEKIGLLATPTTYKMGIYDVINNDLLKIVQPNRKAQSRLEEIIYKVISGKDKELLKRKITPLIESFITRERLDALILGCTELPLICPNHLAIRIIDSLDVLADSLLKFYFT